MADDRVVMMSSEGYKNLVNPIDGKGLHWVSDVYSEIPIKLRQSGAGSETPSTVCQMMLNQAKASGPRNSMFIERNGKIVTWSWDQYLADVMKFAKACHKMNVKERSAVAIMGFNSPEWAIAFVGGIFNNLIGTGIYITNAPEAVYYQTDHSEAEIVCCETNEHLSRFDFSKLPRVKAFVLWGEKEINSNIKDSRVYLWNDFLKLGKDVKDQVIVEKALRQKPGECCTLIYTSGTTGNPKGCMLSHDNVCWVTQPMFKEVQRADPSIPVMSHRVVSYLPLSHIAGLAIDLMAHIFAGSELYFARPDALAGTLVQTLTWARPTIFFAVPRVWEKFEEKLKEIAASKPKFMQNISGWAKGYGSQKVALQMKGQPPPMMYSVAKSLILSKIKGALGLDQTVAFYFGAAPLKLSSVQYFASLDIPIFNVYGMSETTGPTTLHTSTNFRLDTAGPTISGADLKIDNPDDQGEGEICMRGRNTMMGYLKNDEATIGCIDSQGFVRSGDKGKIEKDGHLKITGRIKELIIGAGGENIAPVPVEDNFKEIFPACSNIMMVGEQQRFMAALITLKVDVDPASGQPSQNLTVETRAYFKKELGMDFKTSDEACAEPKVKELIQKSIELTNKKSVSRAAHLRKFKLIAVDFSIPGGELTPTLKLKRKVTEKKHQKLIDEMFAADAKL